MYRPTVRYDEIFREYVDKLFHSCHLDRNQIIRCALFAAAHSEEFQELIKPFSKKDVPLPSPVWELSESWYWMEQRSVIKERGKDVNVKHGGKGEGSEATRNPFRGDSRIDSEQSGRFEQIARSAREVPTERIAIKEQGRISFTFN